MKGFLSGMAAVWLMVFKETMVSEAGDGVKNKSSLQQGNRM